MAAPSRSFKCLLFLGDVQFKQALLKVNMVFELVM